MVCHTDQRAYGFPKLTSTATTSAISFPALEEIRTVDPITGITTFRYDNDPSNNTPNRTYDGTNIADGEVAGNFTR